MVRKPEKVAKRNVSLVSSSSKQSAECLLALDFGTSFSKACVKRGEEIVPLDLGVSAGGGLVAQPNPYVLASTVFVRDNKFLFGPKAYEASLTAPEGRKRFDSPKLLFNREDLSDLKKGVDEVVVPGDTRFAQSDLILLYLAYFTAMAGSALKRKGVSGAVPRRYTVPGWAPVRVVRYASELRVLLARAQVLADYLGADQWINGISVQDARKAIDDVLRMKRIPEGLIKEGLHEATAAGLCALNNRWQKNRLFIVVDIGAGTTDFAAFVLYRGRAQDERAFAFAQIKGTDIGVDRAGNVLDEALIKLAIVKSILGVQQQRAAEAALRRRITESKEAIFKDPFYVDLKLDRRIVETVEKDELLNSLLVSEMKSALTQNFKAVIDAIGIQGLEKYKYEVDVYFTGGGASLPFVGDIVSGHIVAGDKKLRVVRHVGAPNWVQESRQSWLSYFPQLAVAVGAVIHDELPVEVGPYSASTLGDAPHYTYKGNLWCG